jgi:hypothetical protein
MENFKKLKTEWEIKLNENSKIQNNVTGAWTSDRQAMPVK